MMKYTLITCCLLLCISTSRAQSLPYDTNSYIPDHWQARVAQFDKEQLKEGSIIFLGNSITEFGDWKQLNNNPVIVNRGIAGDITFGIMKRLDEVIALNPSKLFIEAGINDIQKNIPEAIIAKNIS